MRHIIHSFKTGAKKRKTLIFAGIELKQKKNTKIKVERLMAGEKKWKKKNKICDSQLKVRNKLT